VNDNEDLGKHISKLLSLLRQIMSQEGGNSQGLSGKGQIPPELQQILKENKNVQVNLCVFAFLPFSADDLDDLEGMDEDGYSDENDTERAEADLLSMEISDLDKDFLKQNGLQF
jgi:hypothetical protein